jgi:D-3-phosphoglycerate dehydrogenase
VEQQVSYVNAPVIADERGVSVRLVTSEDSPDFRNVIALRGTMADGAPVVVAGTLTGPRQLQKVVRLDDVDVELPITDHMIVLRYSDRPGVVGEIGRLLGDAGVNIGAMQVGRDVAGGLALVALTVDSAVPPVVLDSISEAIDATLARSVNLDG